MKIRKAVITAAARGEDQRALPLQRLFDRDGVSRSALAIIVGEAVGAGIEEVCVVVAPGDEAAYAAAAGEYAARLTFVPQPEALGYGHALHCAASFTGDEPFLHMVGDHIFVRDGDRNVAQQVVALAEAQGCSVSAVKATRETDLPLYGAIGAQRIANSSDTYVIEQVREKPTPTEAEQYLIVPGLRSGYYLCFFGIHVLTPLVMTLLGEQVAAPAAGTITGRIELSPVLNHLAAAERYLAVEVSGFRCPIDIPYGLFTAQLGLALAGSGRDQVLSIICDHLSRRALAGEIK